MPDMKYPYTTMAKIESVAIIVNYNDWELTQKTAINHIHVFDKIVVVDNDSSDDSFSKLEEIKSEKIHVIKTDRNGGYGYGNNQGAKYAIDRFNPDFLIVMNPDVVVKKESIGNCVQILKQDQTIGAIAPLMNDSKGKVYKNFAWKQLTYFQECVGISVLLRWIFNKSLSKINYQLDSFLGTIQLVEVIPGSLVIYRTRAFVEAGMYDENIFLYTEERVIARRLALAGYSTALNGNDYFIHYHSMSIDKVMNNARKQKILLKSKIYLLKTYAKISSAKIIFFQLLCIYSIIEFVLLIPVIVTRRKLLSRK
jgi:hypothetical protein